MHRHGFITLVLSLVFSLGLVQAQTEEEIALKMAEAAQNPLASMISLPFQNNTTFGGDMDGDAMNVLNIQPVYPIHLSESLNLITRTIIPVMSSPFGPGDSNETGIGNTIFTGWISPKEKFKNLIWGVGPVINIPTASSEILGSDQWGGGLSAVAVLIDGPWVAGGLVNNIWGFDNTEELNSLMIQYFVNYNLDHGWYLVSAPIITSDWNSESAGRWVVPFGGGIGKLLKVGKLPVNFNAQFYYNVDKPQGFGDYTARVQLQFMFPK